MDFLDLAQDIVSWAVIGVLGWLVIQIKGIVNHTKLMESSTKTLMRSDLITRYQSFRKAGYIDDSDKDEWLNDYAIYHKLQGANGFLDMAHNQILNMPNALPNV